MMIDTHMSSTAAASRLRGTLPNVPSSNSA
jgi:hypothetical protein